MTHDHLTVTPNQEGITPDIRTQLGALTVLREKVKQAKNQANEAEVAALQLSKRQTELIDNINALFDTGEISWEEALVAFGETTEQDTSEHIERLGRITPGTPISNLRCSNGWRRDPEVVHSDGSIHVRMKDTTLRAWTYTVEDEESIEVNTRVLVGDEAILDEFLRQDLEKMTYPDDPGFTTMNKLDTTRQLLEEAGIAIPPEIQDMFFKKLEQVVSYVNRPSHVKELVAPLRWCVLTKPSPDNIDLLDKPLSVLSRDTFIELGEILDIIENGTSSKYASDTTEDEISWREEMRQQTAALDKAIDRFEWLCTNGRITETYRYK